MNQRTQVFSLFILFVLIVLVSGCIEAGTFTIPKLGVGDALKLTIDTEGKTTFDSMQPFVITVSAENIGLFPASNVKTRLQGYDGIASNLVLHDIRTFSPSTLDAPNAKDNLPGGSGTLDWSVTAPYVSADSPDRKIVLTSEVFYDSQSLVTQTFVAASRDYITAQKDRGQQLPVAKEGESKNGPVLLKIDVPTPYVRVVASDSIFRIKMIIQNQGSGKVASVIGNDVSYDYLKSITLRVPAGLTVDTENCDFYIGGASNKLDAEKVLVIDSTHNPERLRLTGGGMERTLNCNFKIRDSYVGNYNTFTLTATATYTYLQDVRHKLIIKGLEGVASSLKVSLVNTPYTWNAPEGSNKHIYFVATSQGQRITSGISKADVKVTFGSGPSQAVSSLQYDSTSERWDATVASPAKGTYDLKIDVKYLDNSASDTDTKGLVVE